MYTKELIATALVVTFATACGGEAEQAQRFDVEVFTDGHALERFETDEGYEVELDVVKLRVQTLEFTTGGEAHAQGPLQRLAQSIVPHAHAHPNHEAGGEVAGEVTGPLVLSWRPDELVAVDTGRFLEANYAGYNLDFTGEPTGEEDPLDEGLMAYLEGSFDDGDEERPFVAAIEVSDVAQVFGGILQGRIPDEAPGGVALVLLVEDDWAQTTLLDGVRFSQIETDDEGVVHIDEDSAPAAHGMVRHSLREHGYYDGRLLEE